MGMAAILFTDAKPFEQSVNILSTEGPMWNLVNIGQVVFREKEGWRFHGFIPVYSTEARADNLQEAKFWS